jgi:hypothetical protein
LKRNTELASAAADITAAVVAEPPIIRMNIRQAHERFGHANEDATRKAAKNVGNEITRGTLKVCEACAKANAKQKNVVKYNPTHKAAITFLRQVFLDIATVKTKGCQPTVTKPNWRIIVDEGTNLKFSDFFSTKSGMIEPTCLRVDSQVETEWKNSGVCQDGQCGRESQVPTMKSKCRVEVKLKV